MTEYVSARLNLPLLAAGQAQKEIAHNEALSLLEIATAPAVVSIDLPVPPVTPAIGMCWIVAAGASGAWAGQAGKIACRVEGGWRFLAPIDGLRAWIIDRELWASRRAGAWIVGIEPAVAIEIGGERVVGARQSAIPDPAGGTVIDDRARTSISAILSMLRKHGLIAGMTRKAPEVRHFGNRFANCALARKRSRSYGVEAVLGDTRERGFLCGK